MLGTLVFSAASYRFVESKLLALGHKLSYSAAPVQSGDTRTMTGDANDGVAPRSTASRQQSPKTYQ